MNAVELSGLRKAYAGRTVLDLERLDVPEGEFFVVVGPSGSGKTTLLRILAGLVAPDAGRVSLFGRDASGLAPHQRAIGFVFQGLALWPHLTVRGNLALGLAREIPDAKERQACIRAAARDLAIEDFLDAKPARLSGGERQRVALARALVRRPALLLLDEPFSDLDARLRRSTARLVRDLHDRYGATTILITHDRTDAHMLADRIAVMRHGRVVASGAPDSLHRMPESAFAAEFLTDAALLPGRAEGARARTALGELALAEPAEGDVLVAVRPDEVRLGEGELEARVVACEFAGGSWLCRLRVGDAEVGALHGEHLEPGTEVRLRAPASPRPLLRRDA